VWGQTPTDEALHRRGLELRAQSHHAEALEIFRDLYSRTREPRALARMALAEGALERWVPAEEHLVQALGASDAWIREHRVSLEENLSIIREHLGSVRITCPTVGAEVWIEQAIRGRTPLPRVLRVAAGRVSIIVRQGEWISRQTVQVPVGETPLTVPFAAITPAARGSHPPREATTIEPTPAGEAMPRVVVDLGGGFGLAFLSGGSRPPYAEQRRIVDSMGRFISYDCGVYYCYGTIEPGFSVTTFLALNVRVNVSRRVGIGVGARFQFGAADWEISSPASGGPLSNSMANLLVTLRADFALPSGGFAHPGWIPSLHLGVGYGQIEPTPNIPSSATMPAAHILSGYFNTHAGVRVERALTAHFHVAGEFTLQFMFPTFLFDMDTKLLVGFHL